MKRLVALALFGALLAGCSKTGTVSGPVAVTGERHSWTKPGVLRIAIQQDVTNLNPLLNSNTTDAMLARLMFEPLLSADDKGNPVPMLATDVPTAENGGVSTDGLTVTYHLRGNAKWTDGVPVTSKDVKWSWQAIMNKNNNVVSRHGYDDISAIDTPDATTVVVHLKQKFSPFVGTFFAESDQPYPIAPEHILGKYPNINQLAFNSAPTVSDGPFAFGEWSHGDHITLKANPNFFMGAPKLSQVIVRVVPDENTEVNLLRTHDIDWMFQASIDNYPKIKDIPGTTIRWVEVNGYENVYVNTSRPFLRDVRVRQAVAYAIDKQRLVDTLTYGQQEIATEDQPTFMWAHDPSIYDYPHDVAKAKALLAQAGWTPGPDGIVQKGGQSLSLLVVSNNSNTTRSKETILLQEMLHEAGIGAEIKYYPGNLLFAPAGEGGILQGGNFDLGAAGWFAGTDPDDSSQFLRRNIPPGGYNYARYYSPEMEAAQAAALEHYDRETRMQAYAKIQELLHRDVPGIYFYYYRFMQPVNVDFKGFDPNPVVEVWNAWQWSI